MVNDTEIFDYYEDNHRDFRYISSPSMDGKYPSWSYNSVLKGRTEETIAKTLREAVCACIIDLKKSKNTNLKRK